MLIAESAFINPLKVAALRSFILLFIVSICIYSCTKIDSTVLGSDLIPAVDNVNTFDTTIDVVTTNMVQNDDSTVLSYTDEMAVGKIQDPLFGQSDASLYFEMKPSNFPASTISGANDSLNSSGLDSTVLCLRYSGGFGDTNQVVTFQVYMLKEKFVDTIRYPIKQTPPATELIPVGSKTISLASLGRDSINIYASSTYQYKTIRELRIPLDSFKYSWTTKLLNDSSHLLTDSLYTEIFNGFALKMVTSGTGAMAYFNISDTASKLEFFYRHSKSVKDTTQTSYYFNPNNSGFADNITWAKSGEINSHLSPTQPDPLVYIKTTPGTAARIRIPGLANLSNRIIHRAELKMYQVPDNTMIDGFLTVPPLLYLERFTPGNVAYNTYQTLPFDLSPNTAYGDCFPAATSGIDYGYFGGFPKNEPVNGADTKVYIFNISRYVQQIITNKLTNADLRLSANLYSQYVACSATPGLVRVTSNAIGYGRVRLGGGATNGSNLPYKMRLHIIYSKI